MSFFDTSEVPQLESAVSAAWGSGVQVTAIIRFEHFCEAEKKGKYPDPSTKRLIESGMLLRGVVGLHAKGMLVDQSESFIFSANLNPFSITGGYESSHLEMGLKISVDDANFADFARFIKDLRQASNQLFELP